MYRRVSVIIFLTVVSMLWSILIPLSNTVHAEESNPEYWAVIIGVSDYKRQEDASGAAEGAEKLAQFLRSIWSEDNIRLLQNSEATKAKVKSAVNWLVSNGDANDTILLYFSGHGDKGYIAPYDAYYEKTWISSRELSNWLRPLDSENVLIILDTCYAGRFNSRLSDDGRLIMASSQANELSYAYAEDGGIFTIFLLEAFDEFDLTDVNGDYELSAEEVFKYAEAKTIMETEDFDEGAQHPLLSDDYSGELSLVMRLIFNAQPRLPSGFDILVLDGESYSSLPLQRTYASGTVFEVQVLPLVDTGRGTRYVFTSWNDGSASSSRTISNGGVYTANYETQHRLVVESAYSEPQGTGWYRSGSTATISITSVEEPGTKHIFTGWSGDYSGKTATSSITVDSPKVITAKWRTEYLLTIQSEYGEPKGEGWYEEGSTATISITSIEEPGTKHIFTGWSGDYSGKTWISSIAVDSPKVITAKWRTEYLLTIQSEYAEPEGQGWYEEGSTATISISPNEGTIIRQIFTGWSGDFTGNIPTTNVPVNSPMVVTADWRTDYSRLYMIVGGILVLIVGIIAGLFVRRRRALI